MYIVRVSRGASNLVLSQVTTMFPCTTCSTAVYLIMARDLWVSRFPSHYLYVLTYIKTWKQWFSKNRKPHAGNNDFPKVSCGYLNTREVHPWYPTLMRLSTVASLRGSLLEEIRKILIPFPLISWYSWSVCSRAGALVSLIHPSKQVTFSFSPLILIHHKSNHQHIWQLQTSLHLWKYEVEIWRKGNPKSIVNDSASYGLGLGPDQVWLYT